MTKNKGQSFDCFISYATEDSAFASEIAGSLKSKGFRVWYAEFELKVGDRLLDKINEGLNQSNYGILIVSKNYFAKNWTRYEMDILVRQYIEEKKLILPIWHGVSKEEVAQFHPGLAGIVAIRSDEDFRVIVKKLIGQLGKELKIVATMPSWENPLWRFLQGYGELTKIDDERCFNLWEAIAHFQEEDYPISLVGEIFKKEDLLFHASKILREDPSPFLSKRDMPEVIKQCLKFGFDVGQVEKNIGV